MDMIGDGNYLFYFWFNDSDIVWIESQMIFVVVDDIVVVEGVFVVL